MKKLLEFILIFSFIFSLNAYADREIVGSVSNSDICKLFVEGNGYKWNPDGLFHRKYFKSKSIEFDGNNDGQVDLMVLKEHFTRPQTNMVYYAFDSGSSPHIEIESELVKSAKYAVPYSWMNCPESLSKCKFDPNNIGGKLNVGLVPGDTVEVVYHSSYTNVFPFFVEGKTYYKLTTISNAKDVESIVTFSDAGVGLECAFRLGRKI